jgi:hypothetical protein
MMVYLGLMGTCKTVPYCCSVKNEHVPYVVSSGKGSWEQKRVPENGWIWHGMTIVHDVI